jgi:hypothetical protein
LLARFSSSNVFIFFSNIERTRLYFLEREYILTHPSSVTYNPSTMEAAAFAGYYPLPKIRNQEEKAICNIFPRILLAESRQQDIFIDGGCTETFRLIVLANYAIPSFYEKMQTRWQLLQQPLGVRTTDRRDGW